MNSIKLQNISLEVPPIICGECNPDAFHHDAVWSLYDRHGNLFGDAQSSNWHTFSRAMQQAITIATTGHCHEVVIRWEGDSLNADPEKSVDPWFQKWGSSDDHIPRAGGH